METRLKEIINSVHGGEGGTLAGGSHTVEKALSTTTGKRIYCL